ncbi:hypothetical protein HUK65_15395 [Rhodobacteraceae bacterium 2376]|uniref:Uncharacterized protein n=1 Tax=Rhabdonatronobacter sediminivivens TaxID=2743469 RepID=A0A7Z0I1T0_9RHOB|nr:hypothetical protein [Rhabdonatronobacter sediminivivens]NYS26370.1 hypothetical protein [Rhabdonatronobacter sediminivivens]
MTDRSIDADKRAAQAEIQDRITGKRNAALCAATLDWIDRSEPVVETEARLARLARQVRRDLA